MARSLFGLAALMVAPVTPTKALAGLTFQGRQLGYAILAMPLLSRLLQAPGTVDHHGHFALVELGVHHTVVDALLQADRI